MMIELIVGYDLADHKVFLKKLRVYGFEETAISWMKEYLNGRSQFECVDGEMSDVVNVPQVYPRIQF